MASVAFLGLGVMGGPMAGHLATVEHEVTVYNRTGSRSLEWVAKHGHQAAPTPAEAVEGAEFVMMCVGNDDDVRDVALGPSGAIAAMAEGAVLVDHTTASAGVARELAAACAERGLGFVDAPVSGGQAGAENGQLTVMCGSDDQETFDDAREVIMSYARECRLLGLAGAGQTTKMVNQICIAGLLQGLSEGLRSPRPPGSTSTRSSRRSRRVQPAVGRWRTGPARWRPASSTSDSRSSGCARTSASASTKPTGSASACR